MCVGGKGGHARHFEDGVGAHPAVRDGGLVRGGHDLKVQDGLDVHGELVHERERERERESEC